MGMSSHPTAVVHHAVLWKHFNKMFLIFVVFMWIIVLHFLAKDRKSNHFFSRIRFYSHWEIPSRLLRLQIAVKQASPKWARNERALRFPLLLLHLSAEVCTTPALLFLKSAPPCVQAVPAGDRQPADPLSETICPEQKQKSYLSGGKQVKLSRLWGENGMWEMHWKQLQ